MTRPGRRVYLRIFLLLLFVGVIAAVGFHLLTRNTHVAFAELRLHPRRPLLQTRDSNHVGGQYADDLEIYATTCVELLRNRAVLFQVLRREDVNELQLVKEKPDPEGFLERALEIKRPTPSIIEVRLPCREKDGYDCRVIVNAVTEAFCEAEQEGEMQLLAERLSKLRKVRNQLVDREKRERNELEQLAATLGVNEPEISSQVAGNPHLVRRTKELIDALAREIAGRKVALLVDENSERHEELATLKRLEAEYEKQVELLTEELTARAARSRPRKFAVIEMMHRDIGVLQQQIDVVSDNIFKVEMNLEEPGRVELISRASLTEL